MTANAGSGFRWACGGLVLALLLSAGGVEGQDRRVLVIGVDGLLAEAVGSEHTPVLNALGAAGAGFVAYGFTEDLTFSGPSWSSILNGVHRDRHGVTTNQYDGHDFTGYPSFLARLKGWNPRLQTAAYVTWPLLENNFRRADGRVEGVDRLVSRDRRSEGDLRVLEEVVTLLERGNPSAIFFYQNDVDAAGHAHGFAPEIRAYTEQVRETDGRIGRVLEALNGRRGVREGREAWLVMVVTDHGGHGTHHTGNLFVQRRVPLVVSGPAVRCSAPHLPVRVVDVSRTVLTYMGVPEDRQEELDGRDLLAACRAPAPVARYGGNLVVNGDGTLDRGFPDRSFDQAIGGWRDQEHTGALDGHHGMTLVRAPGGVRLAGGPADGAEAAGGTLFVGGSRGGSSRMTQLVDLRGLTPSPAAGGVGYRMSAYLGSPAGSSDRIAYTALFQDAAGDVLGTAILTGGAEGGEGGALVLRHREARGTVPAGTARVTLELQASGAGEGVEAYADRLTFVLEPAGAHE